MNNSYLLPMMGLALAAALAGCHTMQPVEPVATSAVQPGSDEMVVVDDFFLVADASQSMNAEDKYPEAEALARSFARAMPDGDYNAGLLAFGGERPDWPVMPLAPYDRAAYTASVDGIHYLGGITPMATALLELHSDFRYRHDHAAVLVLSDGKETYGDALEAVKALDTAYDGQVCIYTVHFGASSTGRTLLENLSQVTGCGSHWTADQLTTKADIEAAARQIFLGPAPEPEVLDSDGDGVLDPDDQCPNTPRGATVDARGCWVLGDVLFDTDKSAIRPQYATLIEDVARVLEQNPDLRIRIEGHTDSRGSDDYNQALSERRAHSVRETLIELGIDANRLEAVGYGESQPAAPNTSAENMQMNRRVELTPLQ